MKINKNNFEDNGSKYIKKTNSFNKNTEDDDDNGDDHNIDNEEDDDYENEKK